MNVGKLKRVAIKEFARSPAKTGILLAALPVALYFCVPLLFGAGKKSAPAIGEHAAATVSKPADFVLHTKANEEAPPSPSAIGWVAAARALDNDLLAVPAIIADARNPFAAIVQDKNDESSDAGDVGEQVAQSETEQESEKSINQNAVAINPIQALGLQLTATMVGQRSRLATINGKTYEEGQISVKIDPGVPGGPEITVPMKLKVDRRFVDLEMGGYRHRLQLPTEVSRDAIVVKSRPE